RIGDEVLVKYLNGDPEQPIVVGRTYHSTTEPPYNLPEHKTRMTIKSKTHKGNGFNELRFEDEKGQEEIFLHAEKDLNHIVKRNESTEVGNDRSEQVERDENIHIGNNRTERVTQDEDLTVNQDQLRHIGRNRLTRIEKDDILNINNSYRLAVHGDTHIYVGNDLTIEIAQNGSWQSGELLEQICNQFELEGYEQVTLQGPGGTIIISREGIELIGNVYVEGELREESGAAEGVNPFDIQVNDEESFYKIQFRMLDDQGNPYVNVPFSILLSEGEQKGITDLDGLTPIYYTQNEENVKCRLHIDSEEDWEWDKK
ncbi:bacteriophage T4 gp5 trimerisation domain-containing protein, partial [Actinobacillus capsulatus]|uniref:type VI secretion system Vgr family protein n=1 Tax=Actinobacillus capsulatus TaxID=717 RepID=UPI0003784FB2